MNPAADAGIFSSIAGLPLHPLVVHVAVVFLPLSALALIALVAVPRWRKPYGLLAVAAATLGAAGAFVAKQSGEALAEEVGLPADHAQWGDRLTLAAIAFAVVALIWFVLDRRREPVAVVSTITQVAVVGLSIAVLVLTVLVGHSGATAVWGGQEAQAAQPPVATAEPGLPRVPASAPSIGDSSAPSATAAAPTATTVAFSLAEVAHHASRSSCWAALDGEVYDLTTWIGEHPGGAAEILGICGTDATSAFQDEHAGEREPQQELAQFRIGPLE